MSEMSFYDKMRIVCLSIPVGKVATYGQIALLCGKPKNSRQVGYGLKKNQAVDVPTHRVVNSKGELSGACYFESPDLQKRLLKDEGVKVTWNGEKWCVDLNKYKWKNTMDDALLFRARFEKIEKEMEN